MGNRTGVFGIATRLRIGRSRGSILGTGKRLCLGFYGIVPPSNRPDRRWGPHSILFSWYRGSFLGYSGRGVRLITHSHLVPRLRMSRAIPLLPLYAFMARTGRTLPFTKSIVTVAIPLRIKYRHVLHQL
jgi:hypothetical protein